MTDREKVYAPVNSQQHPMTVTTVRVSPSEEDDDEADDISGQYEDLPIVKFIGEKIKKRECKRFVKSDKGPLCCCGYEEKEHPTQRSGASGNRKWDPNADTRESPTDAFGEMEIVASGLRISKYVRVDYKTSVDDLLQLMLGHWEMDLPNLLISVTGGAQNFTMKPRLKEIFRQGLVKAAESTQAWIITGGTNAGVMKHVGEALRQHTTKHGTKKQLVAVGIATWGCIENKENLISQQSKKGDETFVGCWPAQYKSSETLQKKKESPLDPNHTHFILVDNGTQQTFGVEIDLRTKLESAISKKKTKEGSVSIPVVCVVLEGGPNTLETVKNAIETGTPAIIVAGSGRAADILAYAYSQCEEKEVEVEDEFKQKQKQFVALYDDKLWEEVAIRIEAEFKKTDEAFIKKSVDCVRACIARIDHLTVFRLDSGSSAKDIDITILRALLKVNRGKGIDQLRLALAWDRVDVAKEEIFTDGVRFQDSDLHELMFFAIVNNRVDFVKLFLDKGVSLKEFLTVERIHKLYNDPLTRGRCIQLVKKAKGSKKYIHLRSVGSLMKELSGELFEREYNKPVYKFDPSNLRQSVRNLSARNTRTISIALSAISPIGKEPFDEPARDLFIWSILHRMKDMAMVFWYEGKETFAMSLIGHLMLKNLLKRENDFESKQELQRQVDFFEGLTTVLLTECYSSNQKKTTHLLVRTIKTFDNHTAFEIAVEVNNQSVFAHPAYQNLLTVIWMGRISDENPFLVTILLCIPPFFLLAPLVLKFREDKSAVQSETVKDGTTDQKDPESQTRPSQDRRDSVQSKETPYSLYCKRLGYFVTASCVKFTLNWVSYAVFLLLYSIILLTHFYPKISDAEIVLIVWVMTLVCEEIRQMAEGREGGSRKFYSYLSSKWNWVDLTAIAAFVVGLVLRLLPFSWCDKCFLAARIVLALSLMTFYFRILHMFSIFKHLGPKLVMIGQMMIDLFYFMTILLVFIIAYGIAANVILYPNQELKPALIPDVLSGAWWSVYGEFNIEEVSGESCDPLASQMYSAEDCALMDYEDFNRTLCPGKEEKCPAINWFGPIFLAIYALITNVMMINLLIAMFSNTFAKVQETADAVWKIQRFHLILDYESHPVLPPPLIILEHAFRVIRAISRKVQRLRRERNGSDADAEQSTKSRNHRFRMCFGDYYERDLIAWLKVNVEEYRLKKETEADSLAKETNERIDQVLREIEVIGDVGLRLKALEDQVLRKIEAIGDVGLRLKAVEDQMKQLIAMLTAKQRFLSATTVNSEQTET